jgi:L-threonylcarbamoyladenylate synthase
VTGPRAESADPAKDAPGRWRGPVVLEPAAPLAIEWTAERIAEGGVVSFPTDTVYALAASLAHPAALARIMTIKGRPDGKPLPVLLASPANLRDVADLRDDADQAVAALASRFWPGALTIVAPAREGLPLEVLGKDGRGRYTVGVRVPAHFLAIEVIARAGGAVAATSANRSGEPPACSAAEVAATIGGGLDILLDGGACAGGQASTVVAVGDGGVTVLREGPIARETVERAWAEIAAGSG